MNERILEETLEECNCDESLSEDEFLHRQLELYDSLRRLNYATSTINCDQEPNHAICESYENKRFKRELFNLQKKFVLRDNHTIDKRDVHKLENYVKSFRIESEFSMFSVNELQPYTTYAFEFFSCHSRTECSPFYYHVDRTNPTVKGDDFNITDIQIYAEDKNVILEFTSPKTSNGLTLGYRVEHRIVGDHNSPIVTTCIPALDHERANNR